MADRMAFGPEQYRVQARDAYVGNECSDEYHETQPRKLLGTAAHVAEILEFSDNPRVPVFREQLKAWVAKIGTWYDGVDEAAALMATCFDVLWDKGLHPYHDWDRDGFLDSFADEIADDADDPEAAEATLRADFAPYVAESDEINRRFEDKMIEDAERVKARRAAE